jgi:hypothetical protein
MWLFGRQEWNRNTTSSSIFAVGVPDLLAANFVSRVVSVVGAVSQSLAWPVS